MRLQLALRAFSGYRASGQHGTDRAGSASVPAVYEIRVYCDRCKHKSKLVRVAGLPRSDQLLPPAWGLVPTVQGPRQACPACADGLGLMADIERAPDRAKA